MKRMTLTAILLSASAIAGADTVVLQDDFEGQLPGRFPEKYGFFAGKIESGIRYVCNAERFSGENALAYNFEDLPPATRGSYSPSHGYLTRSFKTSVDEGRFRFSFMFKPICGAVILELRGKTVKRGGILNTFILNDGSLQVTDIFTPRIRFQIDRYRWHRVTFDKYGKKVEVLVEKFDLNRQKVGEERKEFVSKQESDGHFSTFYFNGQGQSKYYFDDFFAAKRE